MSVLCTNNASSELLTSITELDTTISLTANTGSLFPSPVTDTDWFYATIQDASGTMEIVKCTNRNTDTLTVERGINGTSFSFLAGSVIELRPCAELFNDKVDNDVFQDHVDDFDAAVERIDGAIDDLTTATGNSDDALQGDIDLLASRIKTVCDTVVSEHGS